MSSVIATSSSPAQEPSKSSTPLAANCSPNNSSLLTPHFPTGVYVVRLSNGNDSKTQKIITHFGRGSTPEQQMRGWSSDGFLFLPGHASWGNWNSDPDGPTDYPPDPQVPVGGGVLLLIGFGAAYVKLKNDAQNK